MGKKDFQKIVDERIAELESRIESLEAAIVASLKLFEIRKPKKEEKKGD